MVASDRKYYVSHVTTIEKLKAGDEVFSNRLGWVKVRKVEADEETRIVRVYAKGQRHPVLRRAWGRQVHFFSKARVTLRKNPRRRAAAEAKAAADKATKAADKRADS